MCLDPISLLVGGASLFASRSASKKPQAPVQPTVDASRSRGSSAVKEQASQQIRRRKGTQANIKSGALGDSSFGDQIKSATLLGGTS